MHVLNLTTFLFLTRILSFLSERKGRSERNKEMRAVCETRTPVDVFTRRQPWDIFGALKAGLSKGVQSQVIS